VGAGDHFRDHPVAPARRRTEILVSKSVRARFHLTQTPPLIVAIDEDLITRPAVRREVQSSPGSNHPRQDVEGFLARTETLVPARRLGERSWPASGDITHELETLLGASDAHYVSVLDLEREERAPDRYVVLRLLEHNCRDSPETTTFGTVKVRTHAGRLDGTEVEDRRRPLAADGVV
jgi:hypothetical protein